MRVCVTASDVGLASIYEGIYCTDKAYKVPPRVLLAQAVPRSPYMDYRYGEQMIGGGCTNSTRITKNCPSSKRQYQVGLNVKRFLPSSKRQYYSLMNSSGRSGNRGNGRVPYCDKKYWYCAMKYWSY